MNAQSNPYVDDLSLEALRNDLEGYSWSTLWRDLFSGLSVMLVALPQAMAFSLVAGLPMSCGILAAIYSTIIASLFGNCRHLLVGPNNATAILVQYATSEILFTFFRDVVGPEREVLAMQILTQLVLMVGLFLMGAAFFRLGRLVQFVSHSVVVGYMIGTAIAVIVTQLFTFLGVDRPTGVYSTFGKLRYLVLNGLDVIEPITALVGLGSFILLFTFHRIDRRIPAALIAIMGAGATVYFLGSYEIGTTALVRDVGELGSIYPEMHIPHFDPVLVGNLLPVAFAIALMSMLETSLVAKALSSTTGQRFMVNQEILGLGLSNMLAAFLGALPNSGSPLRSTLVLRTGGVTRFAAVLSSLTMAGAILLIGPLISLIPLCALAALLILNASHIVNRSQFLLCLKATSADAFVLLATVFSCMVFTLDVAFYVGIAVSITFYLQKAAVPNFVECSYDETGRLGTLNANWRQQHNKIRVVNIQGELFFGAADLFQNTLKSMAQGDEEARVIILRLKNARDLDATVCLALLQLHEYLKSSGRHLLACGLSDQNWQVLCDSGVIETLGKDNLFILDEDHPRATLLQALQRAKELVQEEGQPSSLFESAAVHAQSAESVPVVN